MWAVRLVVDNQEQGIQWRGVGAPSVGRKVEVKWLMGSVSVCNVRLGDGRMLGDEEMRCAEMI